MSAFYDQASLVVVPSGYKTSKVYAQKPLTTDGQLTFSRASAATRVNSAGLIEKVRTNLVPNGLSFFAATGVLYTTVTSDSPISGVSSTRITKNEAAGTLRYGNQNVSASALTGSISYTISRYFKYDGYNLTTSMEFNNSLQWGGKSWVQNIDIASTGVTLQAPSNCTSKITNVGNGWYRVDVTIVNGASPSGSPVTHLLKVDSTLSTGQGFLTAAPQLETGDIATDYILTTSAAVSVGPVANVPRLDYLNSSCPRLLLEPQRTNVALFSEQFDNATWFKVATTVTGNNAVSPDGYTNADALVENTATNLHDTYQTFVSASSTAYTFSCYIKPSTRTRAYLRSDTSAGTVRTLFDLTGSGSVVNLAHTSASISLVGNGWYRCSITFTEGTGAAGRLVFVEGAVGTNINYAGNGLTAFWLYGAQLEAGSYATSYVKTEAAAVTRLADTCSKTGISSLIGQTEGTLFVDFVPTAEAGSTSTSVNGGSTASRVQIFYAGSTIFSQVRVAGVTQFGPSVGGLVAGVRVKAALAYKANDFAFYVNGVQVSVGTTGTVPACSVFSFDSGSTSGALVASVNQTLLFKTRLTNAQLAELTTL